MKVILVTEVEKLGKAGDVINVKEGYARNFLFPAKKANPATPANLKFAEGIRKKRDAEVAAKKAEAEKRALELGKLTCTVSAAAGEEEKLFGSVTAEMIAEALTALKFEVDKKEIVLDEPIKKLGTYQVSVKLHPEVKATVTVAVVQA